MPPDLYGALHLPALVPSDAESPADPLLDVVLDFAQAVVNANGNAAWNAIANSDKQQVVENTYPYDPLVGGIAETTLPALFLYRESSEGSDWIAQDYYVRKARLVLYWIPPRSGRQELRARQRTFANLINSAIDAVTDPDARHPSWIVPFDTDPIAQDRGSLFWRFAKLWRFDVGHAEWVNLKLEMDTAGMPAGTALIYPAYRIYCDIAERNFEDPPSHFATLAGLSGQFFEGGTLPGIVYQFGYSLTSITPASGVQAGAITVVVRGFGFLPGATVTIGGVACTAIETVSPDVIVAVTPPGNVGPRDVVVQNPADDALTLVGGFTYT